jgi:hypothetical protein
MQRFWRDSFVPFDDGLGAAAAFVAGRVTDTLGRVGFGGWPLAGALVAAGLVAL